MNASVKPQDKQDPAAQGAADGKAAAKATAGAVSGEGSDGKAKPAKPKDSGTGIGGMFGELWENIKEFFSNFKENGSIGSILGGILGLGGAWLAGNFFGGGIMSTILMVALAVPLMLVGSDTIGGWINGFLGGDKTPAAGENPSKDKTPERAVAKTKEELQQKLAVIQDELEAANRVADRRLRSGQLKGVTAEALQTAQTNSRTLLAEVQAKIPSATTPELIASADKLLTTIGTTYENIIRSNPAIQAEVRTEYEAIRARKGAGADTAAFTPTLTLTNQEILSMVNSTNGQPDTNTRDRLEIFVDPNDASRRLQVRPVADSVADRPDIITLAALREKVGSSATGIVFGQALNGVVSVQAAPMAALPGAPAAQGRA